MRQYLIAFSESGNDSLVAILYLRAGFNKERYIAQNLGLINLVQESAQDPNVIIQRPDGTILTEEEIEKSSKKKIDNVRASAETALKEGALPLFRSMHKDVLRNHNREYFIENVSFHDSGFRAYTKIDFLLIKWSWQPTLSLPIDPQSSPNCRPFDMIFV